VLLERTEISMLKEDFSALHQELDTEIVNTRATETPNVSTHKP